MSTPITWGDLLFAVSGGLVFGLSVIGAYGFGYSRGWWK